MVKRRDPRLDRYFERVERELPHPASRWFRWLWTPGAIWLRIPLGLALMIGGVFGFLPILGFWMLPVGLILIARDIPFLQGPIARALAAMEARWRHWRSRRARQRRASGSR